MSAAFFNYAADVAEAVTEAAPRGNIEPEALLHGALNSTCDACDGDRLPRLSAEEAASIQDTVNDYFAGEAWTAAGVVAGLRILASEAER